MIYRARRLYAHLTRRRRLQLGLVFVMALLSAMSEVVSIGLVVPFLAILLVPEQAMSNEVIAHIARWLGIATPKDLLIPLVVTFLCAVVIAGLARLLTLYATARFAMSAGSELATKLLARTLHEPFVVHLSRHSSEVVTAASKKVDGVINGFLMPAVQLASAGVLLAFIGAALLAIDPIVASVAFAGIGGAYLMLSILTRTTRERISAQIRRDVSAVQKVLSESLNSVRDIIMSRSQTRYVSEFSRVDGRMRGDGAKMIMISQGARHVMEMFATVLVVVMAYLVAADGVGLAIPTLGALALGGQRMLPALQQMYSSWATMSSMQGYLDDVLGLIGPPGESRTRVIDNGRRVPFSSQIELRGVSYTFPSTHKRILNNVNLHIPKGASVGLIGETGSGKTTLANIIMGLLAVDDGVLAVDGDTIDETNVDAWRSHIAYVPQQIYLLDASFEENIAIGDAMAPVDSSLVREAARKAQIASVVEDRPEGYATKLGENGVQLSGGQRQRVGIARALYKRGDVLVLDEATSALDEATEEAVMNAIDHSSPGVTKIVIAHRLTTLRSCDVIIRLRGGRIAQVGSFAEVIGETA